MRFTAVMVGNAIERARQLRKEMTPPELTLWHHLRALKKEGWHFRRQSPEPPYTLDFVCRKAKPVIETDGVHHAEKAQSDYDRERDAELIKRGFNVIRFWASDVQTDIDGVMLAIRAELGALQSHQPESLAPPYSADGRRYRSLVRLGLRKRST